MALLTLAKAAKRVNRTRQAILARIKAGRLTAVQIGERWQVDEDDLKGWRPEKPGPRRGQRPRGEDEPRQEEPTAPLPCPAWVRKGARCRGPFQGEDGPARGLAFIDSHPFQGPDNRWRVFLAGEEQPTLIEDLEPFSISRPQDAP